MDKVRAVFDASKPIDRQIEKVIQYDGRNEQLLKREITEYVATSSIESSFMMLLDQIDDGMSGDVEHEVGIWVSGFYGSGKSSFTKYLGLALDPKRELLGRPFREWLQDQLVTKALSARLATVAKKHPMTVFLLDLSTETHVGPTMESVSTVVYHKVLEWAGYSRERKIAYLELKVDKEKKRKDFESLVAEVSGGERWQDVRDDPMVALTYARKAASRLYPKLWPTPGDFDAVNPDVVEGEDERVRRMLEIIEERAGSPNVLFVIDEVGQYVAPVDDRITNMQGLAQNLKRLGRGRAWIVATAQQTLTEDDARAALNSPKLYKLKDRFPISVDLEASDIREICHKRLLAKSAQGQKALEVLYGTKGERVRLLTQLKDARGYGADLDKDSFVQLYPFLPQHFDILLKILGRLARTTGGVGLRSAIKVVQDVLIDRGERKVALADAPLGTLATAVWFYDTLRQDIERSVRHAADGVNRTRDVFAKSQLHQDVAKAIAVLQVLEDFPLTRENLTALMHEGVDAASRGDEISKAVDDLRAAEGVHLTEVNGRLRFMSERVRDLEQQRRGYQPTQAETRQILVGITQELFYPQPTVTIFGSKRVSCGLKLQYSGHPSAVSGEREELQMLLDSVPEKELAARRTELIAQSREAGAAKTVFAAGIADSETDATVTEVFRSERIAAAVRGGASDKEIDDYVTGQRQLAARLREQLKRSLGRGFLNGTFVFRGKESAVKTLDADLLEATKKELAAAGEQVYDRFPHAAVQTESATAERLLKTQDLAQVPSQADPLGLCSGANRGKPVNTGHQALVDVHDYLDRNGTVDGQKLLDDFGRSPYGWSKDTTRYLVAALLLAGEVKLRVNNQDILTRSEAAVDAIRNVPKFNKTGVSLRKEKPNPDDLLRAADRLRDILGEQVLPLEENLAKAVHQHFPDLQTRVAPLALRLSSLSLPGQDRAQRVQKSIQELLSSESIIVKRLGVSDSEVHTDIGWALGLLQAFANKLSDPVERAQRLRKEIPNLPDTGAPGRLRERSGSLLAELGEILSRDDFYSSTADIKQRVSELDKAVEEAVTALRGELSERVANGRKAIQSMSEWIRIGEDARERIASTLDLLPYKAPEDLDGIAEAMKRQYEDSARLDRARSDVLRLAAEALPTAGGKTVRVRLPRVVADTAQLHVAVDTLRKAEGAVNDGATVEIELE